MFTEHSSVKGQARDTTPPLPNVGHISEPSHISPKAGSGALIRPRIVI